ncbi:zinc finger BED domain-containing protein RICESLEEPER 4-like [Malania oleifera]|uniref:zinc finger BED domain-containing protein RICESLEEPER 4-like n=1 Tax=Malania oleifera TaxID=397392 RepID=UPI0025AE50BC|nr:zinc finger BED domain-containing protein RICESLEEPER 4-like [Malania oleifera]
MQSFTSPEQASTPFHSNEDLTSPLFTEVEGLGKQVEANENSVARKRRKRKSKYWEEFKEITLGDGTRKMQCIHCKQNFALNKYGATSTFLRHLKICVRCKCNLSREQNLSVSTKRAKGVASAQNINYDHARDKEEMKKIVLSKD